MSDKELCDLKDQLSELTKQVETANRKANHSLARTIAIILGSASMIALFAGVMKYFGALDADLEYMKKNITPKEKIEAMDKKINDTYNKAFYNKDTRWTTRGGKSTTQ